MLLQIDLEKLIDLKSHTKLKPIEKIDYDTIEDQIVERDLSFVVPKNEPYSKVLSVVKKMKDIRDYEVFDIYDLDDKKSISLKIVIK